MSEIKPDDKFLINREGVDYKATVDQFAKDLTFPITVNVDCCGGDGSGGSDVDLSEYARLDGAWFTGVVTVEKEFHVHDAGPNDYLTIKDGEFVFAEGGTTSDGDVLSIKGGQLTFEYREWEEGAYTSFNPIKLKNGEVHAKEFIGDGSKLTNLPIPIVEGNVLFKGSVATEGDLPTTDNSVGDMWHVNDDDSLWAWGEDGAWHEVGASTDVDLSNYYTKPESDQKFMPLDLRTLPELS